MRDDKNSIVRCGDLTLSVGKTSGKCAVCTADGSSSQTNTINRPSSRFERHRRSSGAEEVLVVSFPLKHFYLELTVGAE
ncbi:unnamed protein product [Larinioides sclopetarius]|uniref:Uncharacterized protein n=1 Tax=Larinioides sclopetarius TaxID=280406 RepID=A0AAV2BHE9_9ARAC